MSERDLISTDWNVNRDWKGNELGTTVEIRADDPSGWEDPYYIELTLPEAKDFLKELQNDIKAAEKFEQKKKAEKAKEAA